MNFSLLITFIEVVSQLFIWVVIASSLFSFFLAPYHPVREALDRIVDPFLAPIRRVLPMAGTLDFSPLVLILAVQFLAWILTTIFIAIS
ncbi:MAG: YggT family protein [Anaerolineales bacterium]|jgi:YggT family protein|uniref:YggT family protein n=1 Tax=Candidatus Villigracilis proximus TaxID=3140683 RepID=UPI003135A820|nr:YggT family protein [Anaerolineales bacterium]MBK8821154.1 YggT family protein [Anaerolineales bacterium]MBK9207375.1 YggT family protein [Anaerolineales bacterium]